MIRKDKHHDQHPLTLCHFNYFNSIESFYRLYDLFTNLFNNSTFSFWYWPGAILIFITIIIQLTLLSKCKQKLVTSLLGVLNIILLILFSTPLLLS